MYIKLKHNIRNKRKPDWRGMAHSIPPNLDIRTLILKSKILNKTKGKTKNIKINKNNKRKLKHKIKNK
jgi:hypothetical protein